MILAKPPRRRPVAALAAVHRPAGDVIASVAPGIYPVSLRVEYADGYTPSLTSAAFGQMLAAVLADTTSARLFQTGDVALVGAPTVSVAGREVVASARVRVNRAVRGAALRDAFARAVFWSVGLRANGVEVPRPTGDGGATIVSVLTTNAPRGFVRAASMQFGAMQPIASPGPVTPAQPAPPTTPAPAAIVPPPLGVRSASLSRDQVTRYQRALIALGYTNGGRTVADGAIGPSTRASTRAFQEAHQRTNAALPARVRSFLAAVDPLGIDGDLGPATQRALEWYLRTVADGGNGLSIANVPATQGGGGSVPVVRPPAPTPSTPGTAPPVVRPPAPVTPTTPVRPAPSQAGMSGGTIALAAVGAALVGVGIAYKDKLFGGARKPSAYRSRSKR
jgi:peptidoglycan hydrolase-like protein with peptidoglycan-binding domain